MKIFRSFYAKLALVFLVLILALGAGSLIIAFNASGHLFDEVEQVLNREYAGSIALEIQPLVEEGFSLDAIKDAIHYMMVLNPMVEIYLIDARGLIRAFFTQPDDFLVRDRISLEPLEVFIMTDGWEPVLGDDPRTANLSKPFSAAALQMGRERGFVYVILRGQSYDRSLEMVSSSYYLRSGIITFFIAVFATLLAGFSLFFFQTRRLRRLSSAVKAFEEGKYDYRIVTHGTDEIADLGRAFNEMADSIESGVEQLLVAEKERSDLIANISHDLRSPITSIRGHLETILLRGLKLSDKEAHDFLEVSIKSVSSLQKLVEELFDLAKLESRQIGLKKEDFILGELVQDVVLKLDPLAKSSQITIAIDHPANLPLIKGDIGMIERVFSNVMENGIAHTPPGGRIDISLKKLDRMVSIQISDNGPGIDAQDLPHLFERFYRADKSRNRGVPGTGLGLAIARQIVELHEGFITAESPETGGAVFSISLPV